MSVQVVVLGAGYAGAAAVRRLESRLDDDVALTWISEHDYHLVLHEVHRLISDPDARSSVTVPVDQITSGRTKFVADRVVGVDGDDRLVELADGDDVSYDYLLVALGSRTAFYGIPGLAENALTLKSLDDALAIHETLSEAAATATPADPVSVVVGGAGLSGVQTAGEVAEFRDEHDAAVEIALVEALDEIMPGQDPRLQGAVRERLEARDIEILTDDPIVEAAEDRIHFDRGDPLDYDVLVWTGGITGQVALDETDIENNHSRLLAEATFETSDERVFAVGDAAVVDQGSDPAPPTAQAAWQAAEVAADNLVARIEGGPLSTWTYDDKGTLVSIGEKAVAHDIDGLPVTTFGGAPAVALKKLVAARWIAGLTSWSDGISRWGDL